VKRFRGGLAFKAHRLVYHSALGLRVIKKRRKVVNFAEKNLSAEPRGAGDAVCERALQRCARRRRRAARVMGSIRPLEATAWAPAQTSATYRANPILPLSLYQKVHLNVTAMREYKLWVCLGDIVSRRRCGAGDAVCEPALQRCARRRRRAAQQLSSITFRVERECVCE